MFSNTVCDCGVDCWVDSRSLRIQERQRPSGQEYCVKLWRNHLDDVGINSISSFLSIVAM